METTIESAPGAVVHLGEIDLDDRTFEIRRRAREAADTPAQQVAALQTRPILWRRIVPYRILRGFSVLDRLVRELKAQAMRSWESHRVEVAFLEDVQCDPGPVSAMIAACFGRPSRPFDLSTLECARAMRRLAALGSTAKDLESFLNAISTPRRTQVRAKAIARLPRRLWEILEEGSLTVRQAEWIANAMSISRTYQSAAEGEAKVVCEVLEVIQKGRAGTGAVLPELARKLAPKALPRPPKAKGDAPEKSSG
jgi:hypothetical protein